MTDGVERQRPWMAIGGLVLVVASFKQWFAYGSGAVVYGGSNAWGSRPWTAAVVVGVAATLVWFGAVRRLAGRWRPAVAAGLLVLSLGLIAQEGWAVHRRTYTIATVTFTNLAEPPPDPAITDFRIEVEPAYFSALFTLTAMLAMAMATLVGPLRPGGDRRPAAG